MKFSTFLVTNVTLEWANIIHVSSNLSSVSPPNSTRHKGPNKRHGTDVMFDVYNGRSHPSCKLEAPYCQRPWSTNWGYQALADAEAEVNANKMHPFPCAYFWDSLFLRCCLNLTQITVDAVD